jgi:hypothetical protein
MGMLRLDPVRERLEAQVAALAGRLLNAGDYANLVENNQLPQVTPAGYVLPGGLRGGPADVMTGLFRQGLQVMVMVVLVVRVAGDPLASSAIDEITPLVEATIAAVVGWGPADAIGVFELAQAELVGATNGALVFQIDFALNDQLRIST